MNTHNLNALLHELTVLSGESEWIEFKCSYVDPVEIGQYLSAIANAAALHHNEKGYLVWGIDNDTHRIVGTSFKPRSVKKGNEELENWLGQLLFPSVDFRIHEFEYETKPIVLFEVPAALHTPVRFQGMEYIRVGSYKKKLHDYPEKERALWAIFQPQSFEQGIAAAGVKSDDVLTLKTLLFAPKKLADMSTADRIRACFQHACLCLVSNKFMTNTSLRERFGIKEQNAAVASRIIAETVKAGLVKLIDPTNKSRKHAKYVPFWF